MQKFTYPTNRTTLELKQHSITVSRIVAVSTNRTTLELKLEHRGKSHL